MSFATLLQHANKIAARTFASVSSQTVSAWFPASAMDSPGTRSGFSLALSDVAQGPPRVQRDMLSGSVLTPAGSIRVSFYASALPYAPKANETVLLVGSAKATAQIYRVTAVETAGGLHEIECKEEAQYLQN